MRYGIPDFRLDKERINALEEQMKALRIEIRLNVTFGRDITLEILKEKYDVVFLSEGANVSSKMNIQGTELDMCYGANELLESGNHPDYKGKKVVVIGGGNVAMDAARTIKRKGAENVTVIYRRAKEQMPASIEEVEDTLKEGIEFLFQTNLTRIEDGKIYLVKMKLEHKENEARPVPVEIPGSEYLLDTDYVVFAIGSHLSKCGLEGIELTDNGYIKVDDNYRTSIENVYAAGDNIEGEKTVAWACSYAIKAANIIDYIEGKR